jgi:hypothetical protein
MSTTEVITFEGHDYQQGRTTGICWCGVTRGDHLTAVQQVTYERDFPGYADAQRCTFERDGERCIRGRNHDHQHMILPALVEAAP